MAYDKLITAARIPSRHWFDNVRQQPQPTKGRAAAALRVLVVGGYHRDSTPCEYSKF